MKFEGTIFSVRMNIVKLFVFVYLIFSGVSNFPQQNKVFEHFSIEHGLSQSNVRCILQDKQGFLWLGTQDGLNRFDGYNFLVFKNKIDDSNSLSHNYIYSLAEDKDGNIWIATALGGICRYNPITNSFKRYSKDDNNLNFASVLSIYVDSDNQVWAGTYLIGLSKYDPANDCFTSFVNDSNDPDCISSNLIVSIFEDKDGTLWLGSHDAGLIHFDRKNLKFRSYSTTNGLPSNYVTSICENKEGNLIIGTAKGLSIFDKRGNFTNYHTNKNDPGSLSSNRIKSVFTDKNWNIFIGTEDAGLNILHHGKNFFYKYKAEDETPYALSDNDIYSFYEDRSGTIWIGTNKGLNKIKNLKRFNTLLGSNTRNVSDGTFVWTIIEDSSDNIWVGTNHGFSKVDFGKKMIKMIEDKIIYCLAEDSYDNIWIGSNSGLYCFDTKTNKLSAYYNNQGNESPYYNVIRSMYFDKNTIWIGTHARGVFKFDCQTKQFIPFKPSKGNTTLLNQFIIFRINRDRSGNYWFGTSVGLFQYKPESDELIHSISTYDEKTYEYSNVSNQSICIYQENDCFWIGTSGGGLIKFLPDKGIVGRYTEQDGLSNNVVYGILQDNFGNLWLSTNKGISKFNIKHNSFKNYDISDGLPSDEFNIGAFLKSSSGKLYFGSINGIVSFNPEEIINNNHIPLLAITSFKVFDKPHLNKPYLADGETVELSYSSNFFSFEFTALDFTSPEKNQYAYMLEGFDNDWNYIGNRRFASYTNIDPGEYIFRVKGSNNDGIWNEKGASLKILITPPVYRTWWAYSFYVLAFLTTLFSLRQYELNKRKRKEEAVLKEMKEKAILIEAHLRAEKAELQAKTLESEKEIEKQQIRSRIASDLHDEIGSNLSSISLLSSLIKRSMYSGDLRDQRNSDVKRYLVEIQNAARSSTESIRDIVWFINPMSDDMNNLISRLKGTANQILSNIQFELNCFEIRPDEKINPEVKRNLYLIYKEALNNIVKHSGSTFVKILIEEINEVFHLVIEDDGKGFILSEAESGNGLKNIRYRTQQINGNLSIDSIPGKGTRIELKVSL